MHADQPSTAYRAELRITRHFAWPLSDEQELSPGSDLVHADQPSIAYLPELVSAETLIRIGRITRHFACEWACPFKCTLTSRRLPIGLNYVLRDIMPCTLTSPYYATFCLASFGRTRCTLNSLRPGLLIRIGRITPHFAWPLSDEQFRQGLLIRIGRITRHFAWPLSEEQELSPECDLFRQGLVIRNGRITPHFAWPLSDEQAPGSDLVHADQPSTAYRAELVSAGTFN
ncbi:hypothetical protein DPMN_051380 [Dreissena polymorpha]|uniref:Uncharacterized protein n=1 Tax=Dreissena polymorpha TaxID=45954 RepID=A0A9D4CHR5_DREPO|nr:hypothetical protein DPMN_051380 [Dreissena polymorpha]